MAVRRNENGQWRYRKVVKLPDGTKTRISGTPAINTKLEAERAERDHIARTLNPPPAQKKEVLTFGEFAEEWSKIYPEAAGLRPSTKRALESTITMTLRYAHLAPGGQSELISALEREPLQTAWQRRGNEVGT